MHPNRAWRAIDVSRSGALHQVPIRFRTEGHDFWGERPQWRSQLQVVRNPDSLESET